MTRPHPPFARIAACIAGIIIGLGCVVAAFYALYSCLLDFASPAWPCLILLGIAIIHCSQAPLFSLGHHDHSRLVPWGFTLVEALMILQLVLRYPVGQRPELQQRYRLQHFVTATVGDLASATRVTAALPDSLILPGKYIVFYYNTLSYRQRHRPNPDFPLSRLKGIPWKEYNDLGFSDIAALIQHGIRPRALAIDEKPPFSAVGAIIIASPQFLGLRQASPAPGDTDSPFPQTPPAAGSEPEFAELALRIWVYDIPRRKILGSKEFKGNGNLLPSLFTWLESHSGAPMPAAHPPRFP